jgi:transposase InsO family protein
LLDRSHQRCPPKKVNTQHLLWIGQIRNSSELLRLHQVSFSTATIHKVLKQEGYGLLKATRRPRKGRKRYQKDVPEEWVQMDVCKIGPKLYQFTAIDDCTRLKIIRLYPVACVAKPYKASASTLAFLEVIIAEFPFPIQRLQTDRGEKFMAHAVQWRLMELHIKFRPTKPRSSHLWASALSQSMAR